MVLYIDPGTGSMLFTILIGVVGAAIYGLRELYIKMRFNLSGGRVSAVDEKHENIVIFSDHKRYWNVFEPICDEFERREKSLEYMTFSPDDPALDKNYQHVKCTYIGEGNKGFAKLNTLHADILFSSTPSLDVLYWKRSKNVKYYIHIPHAANDPSMYRMFGLDFYDAIMISGDYQEQQIRELEKIRGISQKELPKAGLIYMDAMKKRLNEAGAEPDHPVTVLLAPSWGSNSIFSTYRGKIIQALIDTGYHIIVRPHPQSYTADKELLDEIMNEYPGNEQLEWNRDNDNFDVLRRSDLLISDFSGIIFDFTLVFDKPIIYADTSYDKAATDACWLEEETWTFQTLPKLGPQLSESKLADMKSMIDDCLNNPKYKEARKQAALETWAYPGESVKRTVDYILEKERDLEN